MRNTPFSMTTLKSFLLKPGTATSMTNFSSVSLRKKAWNNGAKTFLLKWGISIKFFKKYYLRSDQTFDGKLNSVNRNLFYYFDLLKCKIKLIYLILFSKNENSAIY